MAEVWGRGTSANVGRSWGVRLEPLSMLTAVEWSSFVGYEINGDFCRLRSKRFEGVVAK